MLTSRVSTPDDPLTRAVEAASDISSPATWDARYVSADTPWDMRRASPPLCALLASGELPTGKRVLVPGCGAGYEVELLAQAGYATEGIDFAPAAAQAARHRIASLPGAQIHCADALDPATYERLGAFDWVFEQTFFCAFPQPRWGEYGRAMRAAIRVGGELIAISMRTAFTDRPPFDSTPQQFADLMTANGFELRQVRSLSEESHPARRGRETLVRLTRIG
ncbi:MAG: methyltransferase domain-containing protein [Phycisphaerae bacterium]